MAAPLTPGGLQSFFQEDKAATPPPPPPLPKPVAAAAPAMPMGSPVPEAVVQAEDKRPSYVTRRSGETVAQIAAAVGASRRREFCHLD